MIARPHRIQSASACVELLESRQLLSASHVPIPVLTGAPFVGSATQSNGIVYSLTLTVTSERKSGAIFGDFVISSGGQSLTYVFTGTVNRRDVVTLHARSGAHKTTSVKGTTNAAATSLSGTFSSQGRHNVSHGVFSATRA